MIQYSVALNNARLDVVESTIGTSPIGEMRTGAPPTNCAAADTGILLASMVLPSDWMAAAANASKIKSGVWEDTSANATGDAGHFRIWNSARTVCGMQMSVGVTGSGADMTRNSIAITSGTSVVIETFTINSGNQ